MTEQEVDEMIKEVDSINLAEPAFDFIPDHIYEKMLADEQDAWDHIIGNDNEV